MSFITKEDFTSHIYEDTIDAIGNDEDGAKLDIAIKSATQQVKGYLSRFDIDTIFESEGDAKDTYADLINYIKDIAKWRFIAVCNVNIDLKLAETCYLSAISELGKIQAGKVVPFGWPIKEDTTGEGGAFTVTSRPKRGNYF